MDYKLAKKLKDAGFPQSWTGECGSGCNVSDDDVMDFVYDPTLSELIEACDIQYKEFVLIRDESGEWTAHDRYWDIDSQLYIGTEHKGKAPEEAVANLLLALNNHEDNK